MRVLVTGASGFVGSLLVPRLRAGGHEVRALARAPERVHGALPLQDRARGSDAIPAAPLEVLRGDVLSGAGLAPALEGVEVAYYLIHSMESTPAAVDFAVRERIAAENFADAAAAAGVRRIVYLGGLVPARAAEAPHPSMSVHLASRAEVERILLAAVGDSLALRASIVIGARSRSFRLLVRLLERLPVLALPAWRSFRTQPIDARDVIEMLAACASASPPRRSIDIAGPDVLTYGEMLARIADLMMLARPALRVGVNVTGVTARVAAAIAGEDPELVLALMRGLHSDLLPHPDDAAQLLNVRLHSFDAAVERALADWERSEPLAAR